MNWLAIRMLTGDRSKFVGLIFGVMFATLLMSQQISIFVGIVRRSASQIVDVRDAQIWVMDEKTRFIDEAPGVPATSLERVRGVPGVEWAVPFFKGQVQARLAGGNFRNVVLEGLDDASLVGAPPRMLLGQVADLRKSDAVIIDKSGYTYMWPDEELRLGREFEINERRAVLVGVCDASAPFTTLPIIYSRFSAIGQYVPGQRNVMNYVLAKSAPGHDPQHVADDIQSATGLAAFTSDGFFGRRSDTFSVRPASRSISGSRSVWVLSWAWQSRAKHFICSRSRTCGSLARSRRWASPTVAW